MGRIGPGGEIGDPTEAATRSDPPFHRFIHTGDDTDIRWVIESDSIKGQINTGTTQSPTWETFIVFPAAQNGSRIELFNRDDGQQDYRFIHGGSDDLVVEANTGSEDNPSWVDVLTLDNGSGLFHSVLQEMRIEADTPFIRLKDTSSDSGNEQTVRVVNEDGIVRLQVRDSTNNEWDTIVTWDANSILGGGNSGAAASAIDVTNSDVAVRKALDGRGKPQRGSFASSIYSDFVMWMYQKSDLLDYWNVQNASLSTVPNGVTGIGWGVEFTPSGSSHALASLQTFLNHDSTGASDIFYFRYILAAQKSDGTGLSSLDQDFGFGATRIASPSGTEDLTLGFRYDASDDELDFMADGNPIVDESLSEGSASGDDIDMTNVHIYEVFFDSSTGDITWRIDGGAHEVTLNQTARSPQGPFMVVDSGVGATVGVLGVQLAHCGGGMDRSGWSTNAEDTIDRGIGL